MSNYRSSVQLGDRVKHKITGFAGIVQCITFWLNGCARVSVQPETLDKDDKVKESATFDDVELKIVKPAVVASAVKRDDGGPRPAPVQRRDPARR